VLPQVAATVAGRGRGSLTDVEKIEHRFLSVGRASSPWLDDRGVSAVVLTATQRSDRYATKRYNGSPGRDPVEAFTA
jgi:hypothetical protein